MKYVYFYKIIMILASLMKVSYAAVKKIDAGSSADRVTFYNICTHLNVGKRNYY